MLKLKYACREYSSFYYQDYVEYYCEKFKQNLCLNLTVNV